MIPPVVDQETIRANKLALVERLADDLAHEIKNPLHSMVINLEVLRRRIMRIGTEPSEDLLRYTGVISSELERVNRRVDLLLRMVRPQRESDELTSLSEVLDELRELVELECERHQVTLSLEVPEVILRADLPRASTRQMILSLILKILDDAAPGSTIHVEPTIDLDGATLRVYSVDGGSGAAAPHGADGDSYLSVAGTLAERLGGHLDVLTGPDGDPGPDPTAPTGYVLCLPR